MRAKPEMKPWVYADKSRLSSFRSGTFSARIFRRVVPPLEGLNKCIITTDLGLTPWALQEYRPKRAHLRLQHQSVTLLF